MLICAPLLKWIWTDYVSFKCDKILNSLCVPLIVLTGIDDTFFQSTERRNILLSILSVWSIQHPEVSYRQGMHEILGTILLCIEAEREAWSYQPNDSSNSFFSMLSDPQSTEAYTYWLFQRIMTELEPLYDPVPARQNKYDTQPFVVHFCTKIQGLNHPISNN